MHAASADALIIYKYRYPPLANAKAAAKGRYFTSFGIAPHALPREPISKGHLFTRLKSHPTKSLSAIL
jgi:hypothetical protein